VLLSTFSTVSSAQSSNPPNAPLDSLLAPLITIGGATDEWVRTFQLIGTEPASSSYLLRSVSSANRPPAGLTGLRWSVVHPEITYVHNFGMPYSLNDGALWAGRGANVRVLAGLRAAWGPLRVILAPELAFSRNEAYALPDPTISPPPPADRSPWANPWHVVANSIDLPVRFGDRPISRLHPGQSSITLRVGRAEVGAATENEWWGPAMRNALLLSSNAPGFPHLFLRTSEPLVTPLGAFDARWLVGALEESSYFDFDEENDVRSISMLALTWQPPWDRGITIGAARAVFAPTRSIGSALGDFGQVFEDVGQPNAIGLHDPTQTPAPDQIFSLFARWVLPLDGFETYAEWGRAEQPRSMRDFLVQPNHMQGYTIGLQWVGPELRPSLPRGPGRPRHPLPRGRVRIRTEFSSVEQGTTIRLRSNGTWYTSRGAVQGYTHQGQPLGAAIGPGSSAQWLAMDYLGNPWAVGLSFERVRWLEDAHSIKPALPNGGWCDHDVSFLPGINASFRTRHGTFAATYTSGWRLNVFFNQYGGCSGSGSSMDVRTNSLSLTFSPAIRR
jgi:hypothetical protein